MKSTSRHGESEALGVQGDRATFSVVIIDETGRHLKETLESVCRQQYPEIFFDIFIITDIEAPVIHAWLDTDLPILVLPLHREGGMKKATAKCIEKAGGEILVFTRSGCIVPNDWLLQYAGYFANPSSGAGYNGSTRVASGDKTFYGLLRIFRERTGKPYLPGDLDNCAYKKNFLAKIDWNMLRYSHSRSFEAAFACLAKQEGGLSFVPGISVTRVNILTSHEFKYEHIARGSAAGSLAGYDPEVKRFFPASFFRVIVITAQTLFDRTNTEKRFRTAAATFLASYFEWAGFTLFTARIRQGGATATQRGKNDLVDDYIIMQIILAFEQIGLFDVITENKRTVSELAGMLRIDERLLRASLEYLWCMTDLVSREGDVYSMRNSFIRPWSIQAYKPVFDHMADLMRGNKRYGKDVFRDTHYYSMGAERFSRDAVRKALEMAVKDRFLIDLGCGWGEALVAFTESGREKRGLGIDIDPSMIEEARRHVGVKHLEDRISFVVTDILDIDRWKGSVPSGTPMTFISSAVLHEFLIDGEEKINGFLRRMKSAFPTSRFLLVEFDARPYSELKNEQDRRKRSLGAKYLLLHPFTEQGMPRTLPEWVRILEEGGWQVKPVRVGNFVIYDAR